MQAVKFPNSFTKIPGNMTSTEVKAVQPFKQSTNFTLGDEKTNFKSSYYKDYIETKHGAKKYVKPAAATPPSCAKIYSPEQFPFAHVATTTQQRDFANKGPSIFSGVFRERIQDLNTIKTIHIRNSVVFGPNSSPNPYVSCAMADYKHPAETARRLMQRRDNF
ncbi:uncharacterized protein [Amphiura filiformis]|uniref:uncharacterized protein n=1 Tax=Amphiura filiformis TaxID=82378 RepID=UPI003B211240